MLGDGAKKGAAIGRLLPPPPPLWVHLFDDSGKIWEDGSTSQKSFLSVLPFFSFGLFTKCTLLAAKNPLSSLPVRLNEPFN